VAGTVSQAGAGSPITRGRVVGVLNAMDRSDYPIGAGETRRRCCTGSGRESGVNQPPLAVLTAGIAC
jgi:hypothetical protein